MMNAIRRMPNVSSPIAMRLAKGVVVAMLAVLCGLSSAMAQSATATALTVTSSSEASGSIFTLTAAVSSGGAAVTGGTVKFTDSYNGITVFLGTAHVQSANGTPGSAVLNIALAGGGTHSITASFIGNTSYAASASSAQSVTLTTGYPTTVTLGTSGGTGNYTLTAALAGVGNGTPTGDLTINDTTAGVTLSTVALNTLSLTSGFGAQQTYATGTDPVAIAVGDFNGDGKLDLAIANYGGKTVSVLLGNGDGTFQTQVTYAVGSDPYAIVAGDFNGDGKLDLAVANYGGKTVSVLLGNGDGTFQTQVTYAVGSDPIAIAVGDFNGDGKLDLAVTNLGGATVGVLLGNGDGTFQTQVTYAVGNDPDGIVAGDFNGDGKLDLAIANYGGKTVSVLLGNGDGTFQTQATYAVGTDPYAIVAGDFNGDGKLDLAVANYGGETVSVLLGNGDGTFQTQVTYAVGTDPSAIAVGDFNRDGELDLAVANRATAGTVSVLLGNGDGTFQTQVTYAVGNDPDGIVAGDFNGEETPDLAVANYGGATVSVLLGGEWAASTTLTSVVLPGSGIQVVDAAYSGDSSFSSSTSASANLVGGAEPTTTTNLSVNPASGSNTTAFTFTAAVLASNGVIVSGGTVTFSDSYNGLTTILGTVQVQAANGTAVLPTKLPAGSHSVTAIFNGTDSDLPSTSAAQTVTVTGTYATSTLLASSGTIGNYTLTATVEGFGSGTPTGSVAFNDTTAAVALGSVALNSPGFASSFTSPQTYTAIASGGNSPVLTDFVIGDFNGDGIPDMAVLNDNSITNTQSQQTVNIFLGNGDGTFQSPVVYNATNGNGSSSIAANNIAAGDVNGDGVLDLVISDDGDNEIWVLLGNGNGSFGAPTGYSVTDPGNIVVADFNGDGYPDLAVNSGSKASGTVSILLGNGNGTFENAVAYSAGENVESVVVGDFNGDGIPDLAVANSNDPGTVSVLLGNGDGTFQTQVTYAAGNEPIAIAIGDFNGDGKLDLAVTNFSSTAGTVSVLLGNGNGTFQAPAAYAVGSNPTAIAVGDFNGDGKPDLAVVNGSSATASVLLGKGDGTFQPQMTYAVGTQPGSIRAADLNGDGKSDLAVLSSIDNSETGVAQVMLSDATETVTLSGVSLSGTGTHEISATYPGDANFSTSTSTAVPLLAEQIATTLTLMTSPAATVVGQPVTLMATLNPYVNQSSTTNGETVTFLYGTTTLGTGTLTNGVATLLTYALPFGTDSLTAVYAGDTSFQSATSAAVNYVVSSPAATVTALSVSANSGATGSTFTLTATVTSNGTPLTAGLATFADTYNGVTTTLGTAQVQSANGQAVLLTILAGSGTHSITASIGELAIYQSSVSAAQTITLTGAYTTSTALASSGSAGDYTLTATVTGFGRGTPTSNVAFNDTTAGVSLGSAALSSPVSGFAAQQTFAAVSGVEQGPLGVAAGDFNGDGIPDLAVVTGAQPGSGCTVTQCVVNILLGKGDGTFQAAQGGYSITDSYGDQPSNIVTGDFNGDGKLDLAFGTYVLLGNGDGTFAPPAAGNGIAFEGLPVVGDFNGDGIPDIVGVGNAPVSLDCNASGASCEPRYGIGAIYLGNGNGTFTEPTSSAPLPAANLITVLPSGVSGTAVSAATGDFNGDGKLDLAVYYEDTDNNTYGVSILLGNGDGTFQPPVAYAVTTIASAAIINVKCLAVADVNGDGKPDLIISGVTGSSTYTGVIGVLLGNGNGTFQAETTYPVGTSSYFGTVTVADFNGDGKPDVATTYYGTLGSPQNVALLLGNGDGTFQTPALFSVGADPYDIAVADFNGDGRPDLVVTDAEVEGQFSVPEGGIGGAVSVLLGGVTETASLTGVSAPGSGNQAVDAVYEGDTSFGTSTSSTAYLTGSEVSTTLTLSTSTTTTTPGTQVTFTATLSPYSNGSATTNGEEVIFLNGATTLGTGTLSGGVATYTTSFPSTGTDSITAIYAGDTYFSSSQSSAATITVGTPPPASATTNLTVTPASGATGSIFTLTATPLGTGGAAVTGGTVIFYDTYNGVTSPLGTAQVRTASGYALLKTALGGAGTHSLTASYAGDNASPSSASAAQAVTITGLFPSTTTIASSGTVGDYTLTATVAGIGNGTPTGPVAFNDTSTGTALGTATLNSATLVSGFGAPQSLAAGAGVLATGDFNGDGIPDIVQASAPTIGNTTTTIEILLGNGNGTFQTPVTYAAGSINVENVSVTVGDFNGDGKLDLAVTNNSDDTISVLLGNGDGTFQTQVTYAVGASPDAIAVGDVNGDGKLDLAVANADEDTVSILLGNGDGTFQAQLFFVVGSYPTSVAVGDVNGDGKPDLVVTDLGDPIQSTGGTVNVLLGNGDGTFQSPVSYTPVNSPDAVTLGDFNGDGKLDMVAADSGGEFGLGTTINVFLGNGDGTFQAPVNYTVGTAPSAITAADINKDGKLDLAVGNVNEVSILLGNGDGTFQAPTTYQGVGGGHGVGIAGGAGTVVVADFNGDGRPDLAGESEVLLGEATETATLTNVYVPGSITSKVDAAYNGDTYFAGSTSSVLSLLAGQIVTTTTLTASPATAAPGQSVVLTATLSPATVGSETANGATITFLNGTATLGTATLANGVATFTATSLALGPNPITAVFAGEAPFSASTSLVDTVVIAPATSTALTVTPGSGATGSVFTLTASVQLAGAPVTNGTVTFEDSYNGRTKILGTAQIQTTGQAAALKTTLAGAGSHTITAGFAGTGTGGSSTSAAQTVTLTGTYATTTALASTGIAGNYTLTATVTGYGNPTPTGNVAFNDTTSGATLGTAALNPATLATSFLVPPFSSSSVIETSYATIVGDFNGDGIPDVATTNRGSGSVTILLGTGNGTFTQEATTFATGESPVAIAAGDFNGDGKLDLVTANYGAIGGGTTISVLLGNGDGTFQTQVIYNVGNTPYAIAVGDFNGDGKLDLAVANVEGDTVSILLGNGDGTFQPQVAYGVQTPYSIAIGDFNGDGKPDLAIASAQINDVSILLGNGDGTFQAPVEYPAGSVPTTVFAGDYNGDGKQDVIAGNDNGASVLLGNGDGTFRPQVAYSEGIYALAEDYQPISQMAVGDINGDGKPDLIYGVGDGSASENSNGSFQAFGSIIVAFGNGDGTFQSPVKYAATSVEPATIALGDFNGDGRLDLAVADALTSQSTQSGTDIYLNTLTETATLTGVSATGSVAQTVDGAYTGDTNFIASTSAPITLSAGIPTAVTVTASASAIAPGTSVTLTATLASFSSGSLTTNGESVTFLDGTTTLGTTTLTGGVATLTTTTLPSGANSITVVYAGDATFGASTSPAFVVFVDSASATTLTVTPGTGATGSAFTLSATVQSNGAAVSSGTITFTDSYNGLTKTLGSAQVQASSAAAVLTTVLAGPGLHSITASYGGIAGSGSSVSVAQTVTLSGLLNTTTALASSGTAGDYTLTATVTGYGNSTPTGSVLFTDATGGVTLGTTALNSSMLVSGFSAPQSYATGTNPGPVVVGDFNNDGIPDVAVASDNSGTTVSVLLGNGNGTFKSPITISMPLTQMVSIVAGDLNGDGKLDLAVMGKGSSGFAVAVLLGNGDGTFQTPATYNLGAGISDLGNNYLAVGDFNNDGKLDLAATYTAVMENGSIATIGILLGNGDGTFQAATTTVTGGAGAIAVGDFNGDGKLDLATGDGGGVAVFLGNGNGTFQVPVTYSTAGEGGGEIVAADFNGDGKLDLAVDGEGEIAILLGNGDGTFQSALNLPGPGGCGAATCYFTVGDFNGDGKLDLASSGYPGIPGSVTLFFGNGDGTFVASSITYPDGSSAWPLVATADFNGDGKLDLVTIDYNNNVANVLLGEQVETATLTGLSVPGSGTPSVSAAYSGDTNYGPSNSSPITLTASQIATKLTLTANAPPSNSSQVTLVAILTPASDGSLTTNGETVTFLSGTTTIGTATLLNGVATLVTTAVPAGATNITASYPGDANFLASQSAPTSVVLKAILLVTANSLNRPLNQANPTLTYTITGFVNGDTQASATTGAPSLTTTATQTSPAGSYPITITQGTLAAPNYNFTFINGTLTVTGESQTLTFPALANVVYNSTPITLSATASSNLPVTYSITGPATVSGSTLTLTGAGTVTVTANQVGNGTYAAATAVSQSFTVSPALLTATASSVSRAYGVANPALTYTLAGFVNSDTQASATTGAPSLTTTATPASALGTYPVTITQGTLAATNYTFTFVNATLTVTGVPLTVSANNASRAYGAANPAFTGLVQGAQNGDTFTETYSTTATATSSPGTYPITPTAVGTNLADYTVTTVNGILTVTQASTTVTLTANNSTSGAGSAVTFTAQVASSTTGTPTGTVSFYNGATLLGTGPLNASGQAAYSSSTLAIGSYSITAAYGGDVNFTASTSPAFTETIVQPGSFTLGSSPSNQTVSAGGVATYTITVSPSGAVTTPVTFSATGLPAGATATFSPASVSPGATPVSTTLTIQTGAQTAALTARGRRPGSHSQLAMFAMSLLMLPLFGVRAIRNRLGRLSYSLAVLFCFALSLGALIGLSGCGGGSGTPPSTQSPEYTVTVTATSGSLAQSTTVTLTVQ